MVAGMNLANFVVVVPASSPHQTFKDFVEYGRQNSGKINVGHYSEFYRLGSISLLKHVGVEENYIPYQSATPVINDLAGKTLDGAILPAARHRLPTKISTPLLTFPFLGNKILF